MKQTKPFRSDIFCQFILNLEEFLRVKKIDYGRSGINTKKNQH